MSINVCDFTQSHLGDFYNWTLQYTIMQLFS